MKKMIFSRIYLYVWCICLAACQQQTSRQPEADTLEETGYRVIGIKDGDTIELLKDGKPLVVRLHGIDTPEKNQDFGTRARQFTSDLVFSKMVELEVASIDRYGRTVGIIRLADGRSLNEELVRAGLAWHYKAYSKDPALAALETEARLAKRGLWAGPTPSAPWDFRKGRRSLNQAAAAKAKALAAKKAALPKKTWSATGRVFLCNSKSATTYHLDQQCRQLMRCKAGIITVSGQAAKDRKRKACKSCAA
jgi:micrococcal nuclease